MIQPSRRVANYHYAIRNIVAAAEVLERRGRHVTYLNIGDPQAFGFRPPMHVVEPVQKALRDNFTGYAHSRGLFEARQSIANYATKLQASTQPQDIIITSGASEAADLVLTALLNEGDEVLLPAPGYPLYAAILAKLGAIASYYTLEEKNNWQPAVEQIASRINERTKAIVLINPNNPTGAVIPDETTLQILELADKHQLLVIADEVYRQLCFIESPTSASVFAEKMGLALITLESLSKTHLIPGWRVGWMRFTRGEKMSDLIRAINQLASGRLCSPTPTQYAIKPALEGDQSCVGDFLGQIRSRRECAVNQIKAIEGLSCMTPEAAFYLMVKVEDLQGRTDEQFVLDMLETTAVLVVHGSGFGCQPNEGYFRMVYLADEEMIENAGREIKRFLSTRNS
ncbi:MAG TPA: aminotransferase class I/II-fold pyridoxal phosphate-dependent enzyme [Pyrinomonadaceae bacterium]|jgi:aspartate/methionine/tyrosine aminotransferase|nr:aminotransferase class I/II-fold pyridoxal phosphate-dependent enzyme [Pyrinomonadaceae bacterium]